LSGLYLGHVFKWCEFIEDTTRWREFYLRVARTISHSFAALTREILFLLREPKIIFELACNVLFIIQTNNHPNTNRREKEGNDVIDIFTSDDMDNTPLSSRMQFRMNFMSG